MREPFSFVPLAKDGIDDVDLFLTVVENEYFIDYLKNAHVQATQHPEIRGLFSFPMNSEEAYVFLMPNGDKYLSTSADYMDYFMCEEEDGDTTRLYMADGSVVLRMRVW